jgi:hypothetical protein
LSAVCGLQKRTYGHMKIYVRTAVFEHKDIRI